MLAKGASSNPSSHVNKRTTEDLYTTEYEINDVRIGIRNILTKGQTHDEICQKSGASSISTRGRFQHQTEKNRGGASHHNNDRPLFLFIQGNTKQAVDLAVKRIEEIIQMEPPPQGQQRMLPKYGNGNNNNMMMLANNNAMIGMGGQPPNTSGAVTTTSTTCVEKIMVGLDHAPPSFDLRGRLIGSGGANLNYIRTETGAMATLRGRGSLFIDSHLGHESQEPLHLFIEHLRYDGLEAAKQLTKNLIETLQQELIQFQQMNPPTQYSQAAVIQQQPQIFTQQTMAQPIAVPPPMLAVPPPILQQAPPAGATVIQQPSFIQQQTNAPPPQQIPTSQHQLLQQTNSAVIPQSMPIQIHQTASGNVMQIQQSVVQPTSINNVNLPPPGVHLKAGPQIPHHPHLSQPPPSLQLQPQIVLNQPAPAPPPNYQYQFIQTQDPQQPQTAAPPPNHVTIQHIYQPQHQPMQSIIQQGPVTQSFDPVSFQQQQLIRPQQQYITVQGNTAFMVPPPNIITSSQTQHPPPHGMVFSSMPQQIHPSGQEMQTMANHQLMQQPPPAMTQNHIDEVVVKLDQQKQDDNSQPKGDGLKMDDPGLDLQALQHQRPPIVTTITSIPMCQAPPPIMSVPPPGVQHLMANTYITNHPPHSQPNNHHHQQPPPQQLYSQVPVSIHQIHHHHPPPQSHQTIQMVPTSAPQQQQHILVNHPWQPGQLQSLAHTNQLQAVQISHHQSTMIGNTIISTTPSGNFGGGGTYQQIQHPIMTTTTFNPQMMPGGMQLQFQQQQQPPQNLHLEHIMHGNLPPMPPTSQYGSIHPQQLTDNPNPNSILSAPNGPYPDMRHHQPPISISGETLLATMPRIGQKRKIEEDDLNGIQNPRNGMGNLQPTSQHQRAEMLYTSSASIHHGGGGGTSSATVTAPNSRAMGSNNKKINCNNITSSADTGMLATHTNSTTTAAAATSSDENQVSERIHMATSSSSLGGGGMMIVNAQQQQQSIMPDGTTMSVTSSEQPMFAENSFMGEGNNPPAGMMSIPASGQAFADGNVMYTNSNGYGIRQTMMQEVNNGIPCSNNYQPIVRCNIMGKPPPPTSTQVSGYGPPPQQQQRFRTQW